jgi:hypothetical protein
MKVKKAITGSLLGLAIGVGVIGLAPAASAESCVTVQAAIAEHNARAVDTSSQAAVDAYNREADQLESRQTVACLRMV